ncbi:hypothetical protein G6F63_014729 [Rhizopus arrhizus]|nr:hypothetical protein G6F63_014729 [Rhizopus arrhizus]
MRAAVQVCTKRLIPVGQVQQFLADFARFDAPGDVVQQQGARGEALALEVPREQPVRQVGFGAFHDTQVQDAALFIAHQQMPGPGVDAVDAPGRRDGCVFALCFTLGLAAVAARRHGCGRKQFDAGVCEFCDRPSECAHAYSAIGADAIDATRDIGRDCERLLR